MRRSMLFAAALGLALPASAQLSPAASAYAERRALAAMDDGCRLLPAPVRAAVEAGAKQAAGVLRKEGWTKAEIETLSARGVQAASRQGCAGPDILAAANRATSGYKAWVSATWADFPGRYSMWSARRRPDAEGFVLRQTIGAAAFGVRENAVQLLLSDGQAPRAGAARLLLRDPARLSEPAFDAVGARAPARLMDAAAPQGASLTFHAQRRFTVPATKTTPARVGFTFAPAAFAALEALDPREAAVIVVEPADGRSPPVRLFLEVGDIAAARAFLAARPIG